MNEALERLAREVRLDGPANERMRLAFGYGAVADLQSFEPEHQWQVSRLASLAREGAGPAG
jgi:hypothetical protein